MLKNCYFLRAWSTVCCLLLPVKTDSKKKSVKICKNCFCAWKPENREQIFEKYGQVGLKKEISENCAWKPILAIQKLNLYITNLFRITYLNVRLLLPRCLKFFAVWIPLLIWMPPADPRSTLYPTTCPSVYVSCADASLGGRIGRMEV